jgi:hypothetical protein
MSHAGNIKGGRGTYIGRAPTRPEGGPPGHARKAGNGNGVARDERTRVGGMPTQAPATSGRTSTRMESPRTTTSGLDFSQDGLETRGEARSGRAREGVFEAPRGREGSRSTGERPRLERQVPEGAEKGTRFDSPSSPRTGERPRLPERRSTMEAPRQTEFQLPVPTPGGPEVHEGAEARPLEELLPEFPEPIGEESLAHHFAEELRFLGAELRPSRMAPSERAERLWAFFLAYAEANAKDPAGQTEAGRELFREALTEHGFAGLREANTGQSGVEVALELLEAQSPEELHEKLAGVRIEPGPEHFSSEVSLPVVEEHSTLPEMPAVEPHASGDPKDTQELKDSQFRPTPERPMQEAKATPQEAKEPKAQQAGLDQTDQPVLPPLQAGEAQQGVMAPGMLPPHLRPVDGEELQPNPDDEVPVAGHSRRGTNKRLGSHMVWNFLHRFRDPPELSAVEREKWSQVAFGAILALVGAALLLAMLVSL